MTDLKQPNDKFCPCVNWAMKLSDLSREQHHPDCDGHGNRLHVAINTGQSYVGTTGMDISRDGWTQPDTLQLLVIDLGDCCVVKVEKGDKRAVCKAVMPVACICEHGNTTVTGRDFEHVKESIDALDGDKPVPRLEKIEHRLAGYAAYYLITDNDEPADSGWLKDKMHTLYPHEVKALEELAGHPLPIYDGGKWEQLGTLPNLIPVNNLHPDQDLSAFAGVYIHPLPFKVWRYTR